LFFFLVLKCYLSIVHYFISLSEQLLLFGSPAPENPVNLKIDSAIPARPATPPTPHRVRTITLTSDYRLGQEDMDRASQVCLFVHLFHLDGAMGRFASPVRRTGNRWR